MPFAIAVAITSIRLSTPFRPTICRDVVAQRSAATKALEQAGFKLVASGLAYCLENPEQAEADGYAIEEVQRMFMKLA
jgi:DNA-binding FrmR family transcriptional regulator